MPNLEIKVYMENVTITYPVTYQGQRGPTCIAAAVKVGVFCWER